jgi:hypothetical protein
VYIYIYIYILIVDLWLYMGAFLCVGVAVVSGTPLGPMAAVWVPLLELELGNCAHAVLQACVGRTPCTWVAHC